MAQSIEVTNAKVAAPKEKTAENLSRRTVDLIVSWSSAVVAAALVLLGAAAVYGGLFAMDNVRDRLEPQNITVGPASEMTPEERAIVGDMAGEKVDTGTEAEAYSRYIGLHVSEIGGGQTYSELGGPLFALEAQIEEAQAAGEDTAAMEEELAALRGQRDTVFKGETLRAILLNAYGWWTVGTIALYAGIGMVVFGLILGVFVFFGFRHARKTS